MKTRIVAGIVAMALVAAACGSDDGGDRPAPDIELTPAQQQRETWLEQRPAEYSFTYEVECCGLTAEEQGPYVAEVRGGEGVVVHLELGEDEAVIATATEALGIAGESIDDFFDYLDRADREGSGAAVVYDGEYGFPSQISVDSGPGNADVLVRLYDFRPGPPQPPELTMAQEIFDDASRTWARAGLTDYRFTLAYLCLCPETFAGPFEVTVEDGVVTEATYQGGPAAAGADAAVTIDDLLGFIDDGLRRGVEVEADYDFVAGYPRRAVIDVDAVAVDGGLVFEILEFVPITAGSDGDVGPLQAARELWAAADFAAYEFTLEIGCFCPPEARGPFRVMVVDGRIDEVLYEGRPASELPFYSEPYGDPFLTVEELFATVERAIALADELDVVYHPTLGFPEWVDIDWDFEMADEEISYLVTELG